MYKICINKEEVALGLSHGELNQFLLELHDGCCEKNKKKFRKELGFSGNVKLFEDYLYENELNLPIKFKISRETVQISEE